MKKISFMIAAVGLIAVAGLSSCSKKEAVSTSNSNTVKSTSSQMRTAGEWIQLYENDDCKSPGSGCYNLPPIVVTPEVISAVKTAATSGNSGTVGGTFTSPDLTNICSSMDATEVAKLQSGNYYITLNYEDASVINFMAGTSYPVTIQNVDFAFQITK